MLVPTLTFSATAAAFSHVGAEIILVDVEPDSLTIDLVDAEKKITPQCKAIVPVHFAGWPCDMRKILAFAQRHGLKVIEDAAHALPARRENRLIGSWELDACIFSFYANKTITTGEGGMIVTRNSAIAARVRTMRTHGFNRDAFDRFTKAGGNWAYDIVAAGFKYNLSDLAAAIGTAQLTKAYHFQSQRQRAADLYSKKLSGLPLDLPLSAPNGSLHAWHLFPIRVHSEARRTRDDVIALLSQAGIGSSVHYRPLHQMSYWSEHTSRATSQFPVADRYFEGAITLPLFPGMREAEIDRVASVLQEAIG